MRDADDIAAAITGAPEFTAADAVEEQGKARFRPTSKGIEKKVERADPDTGKTVVDWRWFCSRLEVVADTRNGDGEDWGRLLRLTDRDGKVKTWALPMEMLAGSGEEYRKRLMNLGLEMAPGAFARNALHEYISTARTKEKARCVGRIGWHGRTFILPDGAVGDTGGETVLLQTANVLDHAFRTGGTLAGWQEQVARHAVGNSRLAFALSAAFAAPLVNVIGAESGGFHLRGGSSTGKSTALVVAGSVWGGGGVRGYIRNWRATDNGLEGVALAHCDALLCLDEIGQVSPQAAGAAGYMLSNGCGKTRASRNGDNRPPAEWRALFLSSGEISLADKMAEDGRGRKAAAGQVTRLVDLPADAGAGLGLFETLHGFPSADAFARHLKAASAEHYGHAARAFLDKIAATFGESSDLVATASKQFVAKHCPPGADGQVSRVCARFALVAAAGEMATFAGVLPWPEGEATKAAVRCFRAWLDQRGGVESAEETEGVSAVRRFIEAHGNSRFEPMGDLIPRNSHGDLMEPRIVNRAGFRRTDGDNGVEFLVLPEVWKSEVCAGLDAGAVAKTLHKRGMLIGQGGKMQGVARLPGFKNAVRVYVLSGALFGDGGAHV
jgi:uncharacterized protein (DUF927 family)